MYTRKTKYLKQSDVLCNIEIGAPFKFKKDGQHWLSSDVEHLIDCPDGSRRIITKNTVYEVSK